MDSYAIIDESNFPIIRIRFTGHKSTNQNFQNYLDQTKACYRFAKGLAIIFDASDAAIPSLYHQKMQAKWLKENEQLMKDFCAGTAYIIPNAVIRAILKMIFSFQKQPVPYKIFESEPEANAWVNGLDLESNSTA
ncbi:STAS/SEC14 domain-containing protein [Aquiflexum gelatinilyticum]|uniref:STAS/SEC14 domain-containing protein n=1 Tax=Aquiflexum gelatinilyticum TaxID=2961943 RepID=A0A9X2P1A1_9BACT|nr:STAS/SEC14 domain-containing protein [Aquiflexum gelatinilyticum]MCR9013584.1 STAS/SEC14 domain-containing protein [Aquiflexum gelatinilyticum]